MLRNLLDSWNTFQNRKGRKNREIKSDAKSDVRSPYAFSTQEWPPELKEFVQDRQERRYRRLAEELKLGSDPAKAYAHLSQGSMPLDEVADQVLKELTMDSFASPKGYALMAGIPIDQMPKQLGLEDLFTPEIQQEFKRSATDTYQRYFTLKMPTRYEDPNRYGSMALSFDRVQEELTEQGRTRLQRVFLATLPSGDVNAIVEIEPFTSNQVIFFERGLYQYLSDFARLVGGITIPLSPYQLTSDIAIAQMPHRYTMPVAASDIFYKMLGDYVVVGTPLVSIPEPTHNMFTTVVISGIMQQFVMAHEMAHIMLGHLDKKQAKRLEFEADAFALANISKSTREKAGSWAVGFWACDLALTALHFLYKTLGLLAFGPEKLAWISPTHPDPLSRRARLRENASLVVPGIRQIELDAGGELCGMTDGLLQGLWEIVSAFLILAYQKGARPSPMWNEWITLNIGISN